MEEALKGLVFDIQGFSVHDGPGCRTTVFLSGCPLRCSWCCNPEGMSLERRLLFRRSRCDCVRRPCIAACPKGAFESRGDSAVELQRDKCSSCEGFPCVGACPKEALAVAGRWYETKGLLRILERDSAYWGKDGGVTFSGGEPTLQKEFLLAMLRLCRERGFHTVLETCGQAETSAFLEAAGFADWVFADIKHMDPARHREGTGAGNERILENLKALASSGWKGRLVVRVPVLPGFNDSSENLKATASFVKSLGLSELNLLPFHRLGASKHEGLGLDYAWEKTASPDEETLRKLQHEVRTCGVQCHLGSDTPF